MEAQQPSPAGVVGFNFTRRRLELHCGMSTFGIGLRALAATTPLFLPLPPRWAPAELAGVGLALLFRASRGLHLALPLRGPERGARGGTCLHQLGGDPKTAIVMELSACNTTADGLGG